MDRINYAVTLELRGSARRKRRGRTRLRRKASERLRRRGSAGQRRRGMLEKRGLKGKDLKTLRNYRQKTVIKLK